MNNAKGENNQLLRYWIFYFAAQILAYTCWLICLPGPTPHLLKRWNWALQPELDEHTFLISTKKENKYTAIFSADAIFCISIYRFIKCTAKSHFENDVRQFP